MSVHTMMISCGEWLKAALLGTALVGTALLALPPLASAAGAIAGADAAAVRLDAAPGDGQTEAVTVLARRNRHRRRGARRIPPA